MEHIKGFPTKPHIYCFVFIDLVPGMSSVLCIKTGPELGGE